MLEESRRLAHLGPRLLERISSQETLRLPRRSDRASCGEGEISRAEIFPMAPNA